jgi:four helix bundle protein
LETSDEEGTVATELEDLKVLGDAEVVADGVWKLITRWEPFVRDTVGKQLARAADSIGANVAEAYGRFHYGEKLQFLYYARGSLFETKYWLNRALARGLMAEDQVQHYAVQLTDVARQLNAFAGSIKKQRRDKPARAQVREAPAEYAADALLFGEAELEWLQAG